MTSASASVCTTCPSCARSALPPIAGSSRSSASATTASSAKNLAGHSPPGRRRAPAGLGPALCRSTRPCALHALILFRQLAEGFRAAELRRHLAALSGRDPAAISQGAITYQLRRLRLHGLIERVPNSFRYRVTDFGFRIALFFTRTYNRLLRPGLAAALPALRAIDARFSAPSTTSRPTQRIHQTSQSGCIKLDTFTPSVSDQAGLERLAFPDPARDARVAQRVANYVTNA